MRRAGRYIRGMVFEHDHRLGLMQLQGAPESTVRHVAAHACVVFVDETPVCANENASSGLAAGTGKIRAQYMTVAYFFQQGFRTPASQPGLPHAPQMHISKC